MSVALELEYEEIYPPLRLVQGTPPTSPAVRARRWRVAIGAAVTVVLVLLMLPIRALGGTSPVTTPVPGHVYVVQAGDTLASIAARVGSAHPAVVAQQLADEAGSHVVVPGEHLLIP